MLLTVCAHIHSDVLLSVNLQCLLVNCIYIYTKLEYLIQWTIYKSRQLNIENWSAKSLKNWWKVEVTEIEISLRNSLCKGNLTTLRNVTYFAKIVSALGRKSGIARCDKVIELRKKSIKMIRGFFETHSLLRRTYVFNSRKVWRTHLYETKSKFWEKSKQNL